MSNPEIEKGFIEIKTNDTEDVILLKLALIKLEHRVEGLEEIVRGYENETT